MSSQVRPDPPIRVAVAGASGRMGRMLIDAIAAAADLQLVGALTVPGDAAIGSPVRATAGTAMPDIATSTSASAMGPVVITADLATGLANAQVLIDFTRPDGTLMHLAACRERGIACVIGTTGFDDAQTATIAEHAHHIGIVMAPNMSVGVNVVLKLVEMAARALPEGYDIEIIEAHHRHKVDAPSGTALKMGEVAAAALGRDLADCAVYTRHGQTGERNPSTIGFATIRGGDIVGDHTVMFAGTGERIEISHRSSSRATYAQGSLRAVRFLADRGAGLFGMDDVLGMA